ncbi:hypothetical protein VOLCADRAFT_121747 [Volvox carteri f. nagariensis]|uniref:BSD domain-containing protein n=1 Tax=Volvox carteri f. nagariensis TaxID=3068 RepID=D8UJA4_VOLCA|nr:uncharacterized protein VOLCADRAFT_121747 [Volvox carteri f. nagariensis]EFJ40204.1 hypothetical protein VOLCADRAFT_121747 [Volvox carteri f. nagariensis]|eukprot:XP_002958748.1 hypothetical protein VOLCADRAFT_121747 [Volvox carteri f. nagariensis]
MTAISRLVATAVTNTVKARADELVKSVVDTDWRTELSHFSREVGEESKTLKEKTAELVEHLPEQVVHLPEKAEEALHHLPTKVQLPKDVGQTLEGVGVVFAHLSKSLLQGTKELIDELKEGVETEIAAASREGKRAARGKSASSSTAKLTSAAAKYNRFEAEVAAMQRDSSTYCDEPDDAEDYARWKAGFSLEGVKADITRILSDNAFMAELQSRLVPIIVEYDDFWNRYFYRLHKLQQKEEQRQQLAQRAKTLQEDDVPLGWGDEDEVQLSPPSSSNPPAGSSCPTASDVGPTATPAPVAQTESEVAVGTLSASATKPRSPSASESAGVTEAGVSELNDLEQAAVARVAAAAVATTASASEPVDLDRKSQSAGGDTTAGSGGTSGSASVADGGQLEAESHVETASDSSTKEWCVVSSNAQQRPSSDSTAAAEGPAKDVTPPPSESPATRSSGGAVHVPGPSATDDSVAAVETGASEAPVPGSDKVPKNVQKAKGAAQALAEEELDEDWGNWD